MKTTILTTTINIPTFLTAYAENAKYYQHDVDYIVVGDVKSPRETRAFCDDLHDCIYLDITDQEKYMARFPKLNAHHPYNCIERRNIGILKAYENGADRIITLDDDNLATSQDMIGWHKTAGRYKNLVTYGSSSGWFNVCQFLKEENNVEFYHRGYSPKHRWEKDAFISSELVAHRAVVNAGFWLDDPDIDAITRLERKPKVIGYKDPWFNGTIALAPGTWTPFDCQNTALVRDIIPAYFLSPNIGRHSDIFASYIINRLTQHFGDVIAFGNPLVLHNRHPHNLFHDFDIERKGIELTDIFCYALRDITLKAETYHEGFGQIIDGLKPRLPASLDRVVEGMILWHDAFEQIGVK